MNPPEKADRGARRKARTRAKLLAASRKLFVDKGVDNVSIQDITDEADVGFGTFYNHFQSKNDVLEGVADAYLDRHNEEMDRLIADLDDPVEIVSVGWRYTLAGAKDREQFSILKQIPYILRNRITTRALNDIRRGVDAGKFKINNLDAFMSCAPSMLLGVMEDYADDVLTLDDAEYTTVYYLRLLGVEESKALALIAKPLPQLD